MQDDLTKFSFTEATPSNHKASIIAKVLTKTITCFSIPKTILSDQGADFMSQLITDQTVQNQTHIDYTISPTDKWRS